MEITILLCPCEKLINIIIVLLDIEKSTLRAMLSLYYTKDEEFFSMTYVE